MTTYQDIMEGHTERFLTIPGLAPNRVLDFEPSAVDDSPLLYSLFDRYDQEQLGQVDKHIYRRLHRLCVAWQDNQGAEALLIPFLTSIPAAIRADPRLGNRLPDGYARIVEAVGAFVVIGGVLCRAFDFISESHYKVGR